MKARKADVLKSMKALNDLANAEKRDLTEEEDKTYSAGEKEVESLNKRIERAEKLMNESRNMAEINMIPVEEVEKPKTLADSFREAIKAAEESGKKITFNVRKEIDKVMKSGIVNKAGSSSYLTTAIPNLIKREDGAPLSIMRTPTTEFISKTGINVVTSAVGQYPLPSLEQFGLISTSANADASIWGKVPGVILVTPTRKARKFSFQKLALMQSDDQLLEGYVAAMQDAPYVTALEDLMDRFVLDAPDSSTTVESATLSGTDAVKLEANLPYLKQNPMYLTTYAVGKYLKSLSNLTTTTVSTVDGSTGDSATTVTGVMNDLKWQGKLDEGNLNGFPAYCHPAVNADNLIFVDGKVMWIVFQREPEIIIDPYTEAAAGNMVFISEAYYGTGISDYRGTSYYADASI